MNPVASDPSGPHRLEPGPSFDPGFADPLLDGPVSAGYHGKVTPKGFRGLSADLDWPVRLSRRSPSPRLQPS